MRDVGIVTGIYCLLFIILTTPTGVAAFGLSAQTFSNLHHFLAELVFWAGALYICASGTYGAFARQDRFGLSQNHPLLSRVLSLLLLVSPFLAVLWNVRFVYVLLGLLLFSHMRSKSDEEKNIDFTHSRIASNMFLIPVFTLAMMMMSWNQYRVESIFNWSWNEAIQSEQNAIEAAQQEITEE